MNRHFSIRMITQTALLLALIVAAQALHLPQLVTGSLVNGVLLFATLAVGLSSGLIIGILAVLCSFLLGFMKVPLLPLIPLVMAGNVVLVLVFALIKGPGYSMARNLIGMIVAAGVKVGLFYLALNYLFVWLGIPVPAPVYVAYGIVQLYTALIGGVLALLIARIVGPSQRRPVDSLNFLNLREIAPSTPPPLVPEQQELPKAEELKIEVPKEENTPSGS